MTDLVIVENGSGVIEVVETSASPTIIEVVTEGPKGDPGRMSVNGVEPVDGNVTLTKNDFGLSSVENKSSSTIRGEMTSQNVSDALGFVPLPNSYVPTWASILGKPTFSNVAVSGSYNDLSDKPSSYALPTASTLILGGVKVDGSSINIAGGVISTSAAAIGLSNVENKNSATIRNEITLANIATALGYVPANKAGDSFTGNVGIGSSSSFESLRVSKNITGGATSRGVIVDGVVQSDSTTSAGYYTSIVNTAAASFTVPFLTHYSAMQGTIGSGSLVTNQYGFSAAASLVGATNNYGFFGNIPSGTGRWNLYMAGTAANYLAGNLGIGAVNPVQVNLQVSKNIEGGASAFGIRHDGVVQSGVTNSAYYFSTSASTAPSSFTVSEIRHYQAMQGTIGAGSTVSAQYGFIVDASLVGASSNNFGFFGNIPSGAGRWNIFMNGTASNYLSGILLIGTASDNGVDKLQVVGSVSAKKDSTYNSETTASGRFLNATSPAKMLVCGYDGTQDYSYIQSLHLGVGYKGLALNPNSGNIGIGLGTSAATARLHLPAGQASASNAPLKFTAGTNLTTAEDGAVEYDGSKFSFTVGGTRFSLGYLDIPQNSQSANYTLVLGDSGKHIYHPSADTTARTFTIPANASVSFPIGTEIAFVNDNGAGVISIAINSDTLRLAGAGTTGTRTLAANGIAKALKITATSWIISGSGLT